MFIFRTIYKINIKLLTMKKLLIVLFVLGFLAPVSSQVKTKQMVGKWKYSVDAGGEYLTGTLKFVETDGALTVEVFTGEGDVFPVTKVQTKEKNKIYFEIHLDNDLIKVLLTIDGEKMKGTGSNYQGEFSVTGEKLKE